MRECFACHKEIGDVKFCGHCGENQVCQECGEQFDRPSAFCLNCGTKRAGGSEGADQSTQVIADTEQTGNMNQNQAEELPQANSSGQQSEKQEQDPEEQTLPVQPEQKSSFVDSVKQKVQKLGKRNLSIIGGILIVLIAFFIFQGSGNSPEKVIEKFFAALSDGDAEKIEQYVDPLIWEEMLDEDVMDALEMLNRLDVTMELLHLEKVDTGEDYIDFVATVKYDSVFIDGEDEEEEVSIEVMQYGGKWYISDMY
ncbi:zinc ribbon domain-containing protein [Oceanobacillus alkalisoli]|uniref:zinc ribbon domain-containing protein n=1 Tax=Oceanobacillus alkalisoli TaxID=2925113 RepID=UPI001F11F46F|nr:zinc ribbon domain-containing protein [Oceanobacillus alkalisoli]MCF3942835.1 zinc ribbon domain-containing protein [Oceanobacillus alkalisoli]